MTALQKAGIAVVYTVVCVGLAVAIAGVPRFGGEARETSLAAVAVTTTTGVTTTTAVASAPSTSAAPPARPPAQVKVRLYNGSRTGGAAVSVGKRLEAKGYGVLEPGPSTSKPLDATEVWYVEGWAAEAQQVATDLGGVAVVRQIEGTPPVPSVGAATVVVIVAEDVVKRSG